MMSRQFLRHASSGSLQAILRGNLRATRVTLAMQLGFSRVGRRHQHDKVAPGVWRGFTTSVHGVITTLTPILGPSADGSGAKAAEPQQLGNPTSCRSSAQEFKLSAAPLDPATDDFLQKQGYGVEDGADGRWLSHRGNITPLSAAAKQTGSPHLGALIASGASISVRAGLAA